MYHLNTLQMVMVHLPGIHRLVDTQILLIHKIVSRNSPNRVETDQLFQLDQVHFLTIQLEYTMVQVKIGIVPNRSLYLEWQLRMEVETVTSHRDLDIHKRHNIIRTQDTEEGTTVDTI